MSRRLQRKGAQAATSRLATIIPIYKASFSESEDLRLRITLRNCPVDSTYFVGPRNLWRAHKMGSFGHVPFVGFSSAHFSSIASYSAWMLLPELYQYFVDYEFILICQTDAILARPLPSNTPWDFDYLGAPWVPPWSLYWDPARRKLRGNGPKILSRKLHVGNGGLSLRRTAAFARDLPLPKFGKLPNEDIAISYFNERLGIRIASKETAERYFMETGAASWKSGSPIPQVYGFHGLQRHNPALEGAILETNDLSRAD